MSPRVLRAGLFTIAASLFSAQEQLAEHAATRDKGMEKQEGKWKAVQHQLCAKKGLRVTQLVAPPEQRDSPWFATLSEREQQALAYAMATDTDGDLTSVDLSQSMGRAFLGRGGVLATLVPGSKVWLLAERRLLTGYESCRIMGSAAQTVSNSPAGPRFGSKTTCFLSCRLLCRWRERSEGREG
jgi:hypothetical protein